MAQDGNGEDEPGKVIHLRDHGRPHRYEDDPIFIAMKKQDEDLKRLVDKAERLVDLLCDVNGVQRRNQHALRRTDKEIGRVRGEIERGRKKDAMIAERIKALRDSRVLWTDTPEGKRAIMESFFPNKPKWRQ